MQSSKPIEATETKNILKNVIFNIEEKIFEKQLSKRLNEIKRKVKLDGFRPGKTPLSVVVRRYGEQTKQELLREIAQENFDALCKEKVILNAYLVSFFNPADHEQEEGSNESFKSIPGVVKTGAWFEITPQIEINDFSDLILEKPIYTLSDEERDRLLCEWYRANFSEWLPIQADEKATLHQQVIHQFKSLDILNPTEATQSFLSSQLPKLNESYTVDLKETLPSNIQKALIGSSIGDTINIILTPHDLEISTHDDNSLAETQIQAEIYVENILACDQPHDLKDPKEIFKENTETFQGKMEKTTHHLLQSIVWSFLLEQIKNQLIFIYKIEPPKSLLFRLYQEKLQEFSIENDTDKKILFNNIRHEIQHSIITSYIFEKYNLNENLIEYAESIQNLMKNTDPENLEIIQKTHKTSNDWFQSLLTLYAEALIVKKVLETAKMTEQTYPVLDILVEKNNYNALSRYAPEEISTAFHDVLENKPELPDQSKIESEVMTSS